MILYCSECGERVVGEVGGTHWKRDTGTWKGTPVPCGTLWPTPTKHRRRRKRDLTPVPAQHSTLTAEEIERRHGQWREQ